jgi:hypothetical protein
MFPDLDGLTSYIKWEKINKTKKTCHNSGGLINCILQPRLFYHRIQKYMREEFDLLIKSCGTSTVPAAETKSIGLAANTRLSWF